MDNDPVSLVGLPGKIRNIRAQIDDIVRFYKINLNGRRPSLRSSSTSMTTYNSPSIVQFYLVGKDHDIAGPSDQQDGDDHSDEAQRPAVPSVRNGHIKNPSKRREDADDRASRNAKQDERPVKERPIREPDQAPQQQGGRSADAEGSHGPTAVDAAGRAFLSELRKDRPSRAIRQAVAEALSTFDKSNAASASQPEQAGEQARPVTGRNARSGGISIVDTAFRSMEDADEDAPGQHRDPDVRYGDSSTQQNNDVDDDESGYFVTPDRQLSRPDAIQNELADRDDQIEASSEGQKEESMEDLARLPAGDGTDAASNDNDEPPATRDADVQRGVAGSAHEGRPGWVYIDRRKSSKTMHLDQDPVGNQALLVAGSELYGGRVTRAGSQAVKAGSSAMTTPASGAAQAWPPSSTSTRDGIASKARSGPTGHKKAIVPPRKTRREGASTALAAPKPARTGSAMFPNLPTQRRYTSPSALTSPEARSDLEQMLAGRDGQTTPSAPARPPTPHPGSPATQQLPSVSQTPTGQSVLPNQQFPLAQQQSQSRKSPHDEGEGGDKGSPTKRQRTGEGKK